MVYIILSIVLAVASVAVVLFIMLQESKSYGLSSGISGGSDTYWSRNKGRSKEGKLVKATIVAAVVFFVVAILLNVGAIAG